MIMSASLRNTFLHNNHEIARISLYHTERRWRLLLAARSRGAPLLHHGGCRESDSASRNFKLWRVRCFLKHFFAVVHAFGFGMHGSKHSPSPIYAAYGEGASVTRIASSSRETPSSSEASCMCERESCMHTCTHDLHYLTGLLHHLMFTSRPAWMNVLSSPPRNARLPPRMMKIMMTCTYRCDCGAFHSSLLLPLRRR